MTIFTYLSAAQVESLRSLAFDCAKRAEKVLAELGPHLRKAAHLFLEEASTEIPSRIPQHATVSYDRPVIGDFAAVITDIRDSTKHLRTAISGTFSQVERLYFETSVALPVVAKVTELFNGSTTEYLGDGTLSLFEINENSPMEGCKKAYRASKSTLEVLDEVINPVLLERKLPALRMGIGIGRSRAIVSAVGLSDALQPNAFGECVFFAAKLSKWGSNEIYADSIFRRSFKKAEGGLLQFRRRTREEIDGFLICRSE